jgi:hypothetical protein
MNSRKHLVGRVVVATVSCLTASATLKEPTLRRQSDGRSVPCADWLAHGVLDPTDDPNHRPTASTCIACSGLALVVEKAWADLGDRNEFASILAVRRRRP